MNQDVARKIKALLAKEGAAGTTPEEVAASIALAMRFMEREGITRAMLEMEGVSTDEPVELADIFDVPLDGELHKSLISWKLRLGNVIARSRGCFTWQHGGAIKLAGQPSDVDAVRYLYTYCAKEISRIAKLHGRGNGKTWNNNFKIGCVEAISQAIENEKHAERAQQREASAKTAGALVLVNNAIAQLDRRYDEAKAVTYAKIKFGSAKAQHATNYSADARAAGRAAGSGIYPNKRLAISGRTGMITGGEGQKPTRHTEDVYRHIKTKEICKWHSIRGILLK